MRLGLASDHAGFELKELLASLLHDLGHELMDLGATVLDPADDYPDFVQPLAAAVANGEMDRGIALCGTGVGACIAANKQPGVRAGVCHETYSARLGVEHNDMNILVLGARVIGPELACDVVKEFLDARFVPDTRHLRRLQKLRAAEQCSAPRQQKIGKEYYEPIETNS